MSQLVTLEINEVEQEVFLWRFYWYYGRSGSLDGLFVATEAEVNNAIGKDVNFGEVLGKHSEVYGVLNEGNIKKVDLPSDVVAQVQKVLGSDWSGFNPLDYVRCDECGERNEYCYCDIDNGDVDEDYAENVNMGE